MRVSRTVLREARGETPLVYSPPHRFCSMADRMWICGLIPSTVQRLANG